ncbi:thioesterase II family protein [Kibdelosporangium aridum]|uniref:Surfactin synthase thioesterase subunit n=1 Tax=Kibdelosporangium aridum TaxID=2030 RepID=A0A1Y5X669_KIBAR|nr:alpha/beta fold hydrolase [Kibdelosporangium aridum]SMC73777.1 Surfactin synthase thioesterase subunit [Kibdelosporangium aridum]
MSATLRVLCFPHAGGNASFYREWTFGPSVEVVPIQYPGRGQRINEPLLTSMSKLADTIAAEVAPLANMPIALFGHSLGAAVAYEVARRLPRPPTRLIVSGRGAPTVPSTTTSHMGTDDELVDELTRLGGTASGLLANDEVRSVLLPAVRADYQVSETYRWSPSPPLSCPITTLTGDRDPEVTPDEMAGWAEMTTGPLTRHVLPGDHFYLVPRRAEVLRLLRSGLAVAHRWPSTP